jgi:uncharacterized membrane protein YkvA (DUF1232 family)
MRIVTLWKQWAHKLRFEVFTLYFAYRNPRTPWFAKIWAAIVVAYAFSPIDLIPDFIPIIGYLDDLVLIPLVHLTGRKPLAFRRRLQQARGS